MNETLLADLYQLNPWLKNPDTPLFPQDSFIPRLQIPELLDPEWDSLWTVLIGPRRAGKTTLGFFLADQLIKQKRFDTLLYLSCDYLSIREWLKSPSFLNEALEFFSLKKPILFIDEVQRMESPGLLLKAILDLKLPVKHIATGSSQLELKSKVQEFLTGRQLSSTILPLSCEEGTVEKGVERPLVYGSYPQVIKAKKKEMQLTQIYSQYIQKDIIEILKVGKPDVLQKMLTLLAHCSGQLFNLTQMANDCGVSSTTVRNHLDILEQSFVIAKVTPFVGNKRTEVTKNPIYYFIDNGFRNVALRNFAPLESRSDCGMLVESFVFQEILKFREQSYSLFDIHFWRTKSGAEVDFVLFRNEQQLIPIEVKFQNFQRPTISRGYRSFLEVYNPKHGLYLTKNFFGKMKVENCVVHFIPLAQIRKAFEIIREGMNLSG